ncbi:MAG: ABC transporter substrate-binding protein, partial [Alphaproteobacteria bacterium]|nr:ABC transporter substrate-binding protein [Alphaproteobacteria bacterium]
RDVQSVVAESPGRVVFRFVPGAARDMPLIVAGLPILSQAYYQGRAFDQTTLEPPLGSGPYRVAAVDQGRSLTYARVTDWWGQDLPVNRGRYNFDRIRFDFFRDRDVAFEAFKAGGYDFREEFTSKTWATGYNTPAIRSGLIKRETLPDASPSGTQAFFINTRRPQLADVRVRHALGYAFDFEWTNENLFYGLYQRTTSMFENSDLRHRGAPSAAELDLLEPFRAELPAAVFAGEFAPPVSDGSGTIREQLRAARTLLEAAGYRVVGGKLLDPTGAQLEVEFLIDIPSFERIIAPIARNLERLGIAASIRIVDSAQYANRLQTYDYDIVTQRFSLDPTPGIGLRNIWGSAAAEQQGGANLAGVRNPVVDALIERLGIAQSREELKATVSALDRVLLWNFYSVPQWYKPSHFIAYRDVFGRPDVKPAYDLGFLDTWWVDAAKAAAAGKLPSAGP